MLLQQLKPAHIETVYMLERGSVAVVAVKGLGASTLDKSAVAPVSEFEELWALANSAELSAYKVTSGADENVADPAFVRISVGARGKADFDLKIPVEGQSKGARDARSPQEVSE